MATNPYVLNFNRVDITSPASMTSQQHSVAMTSHQQHTPNNSANFCIDHLLDEDGGYYRELPAYSAILSAASRGSNSRCFPSTGQFKHVFVKHRSLHIIMASNLQRVTSQFSQQYHDDVMTSQQQRNHHHMGNSRIKTTRLHHPG